MAKRRYTPDVLAVGAVAFAGSYATQKLLLTPKHKVTIAGKVDVPVQGLLPFSQKYIARIAKTALNNMLPFSAACLSQSLSWLKVKDRVREGILWFIYDFLSRYSLNTVVSKVLLRFNIFDRDKYKDVLRESIQKFITEKADRDVIIQAVTAEVVSLLRLLSEGTLAAMIFNDRFAAAASVTIATAVDRFLENDAAAKFTDFLFRIIGQFEDITVANILTNVFKLGREQMGSLIDSVYDAVLGDNMVRMLRDLRLGDLVYEIISGVDYDALYAYMSQNMTSDLKRLNVTGAMAAMYFFSGSKNIVFKAQKKSNEKAAKKEKKLLKKEKKAMDRLMKLQEKAEKAEIIPDEEIFD